MYDAFYPVLPAHVQGGAAGEEEATHAKKPGRMVNSYTGKECARSIGVNRLAEQFIKGKVKCTSDVYPLGVDWES